MRPIWQLLVVFVWSASLQLSQGGCWPYEHRVLLGYRSRDEWNGRDVPVPKRKLGWQRGKERKAFWFDCKLLLPNWNQRIQGFIFLRNRFCFCLFFIYFILKLYLPLPGNSAILGGTILASIFLGPFIICACCCICKHRGRKQKNFQSECSGSRIKTTSATWI